MFLVLGFLLAWVVGIVANEEISVMRGVAVLVCTGVANWLAGMAIGAVAPDAVQFISLPVSFAVLTLMIKSLCEIPWKPSLIVAAIYSVIIFAVMWVLAAAFHTA
ncbi:MAG: hypothetical protein IPJ41_03095 [Phycisphaerales bacterium]|nr:hypothetical protein [Phycisphaerales bacterium]